jgi:hypothetical protein
MSGVYLIRQQLNEARANQEVPISSAEYIRDIERLLELNEIARIGLAVIAGTTLVEDLDPVESVKRMQARAAETLGQLAQ